MQRIKTLDRTLAARIAAGEVIERPQSVARELIDNAVDAGTDEIRLTVKGGGIDFLSLSDNGCGMSKEDLPLAVTQYATSKISRLDDLYHLTTLGFRGEALHSVSAVAKLTIATNRDGEAWTLVCDNGRLSEPVQGGPDKGTVVTVENLFSEIPARRGFLKRPSSEATLCKNVLLSKAMAFPGIRFTFVQDGAVKVDLQKRGSLFDRVLDILSLEDGVPRNEFAWLEKDCGSFRLRIAASLPGLHRSDRSRIKIYVNSRQVDEFALVQAVAYGYGEMLPGGSFPYAVLFVEDDPELVDFNIHPAKKEVKLRNKAEIHHEVHGLIRSSLPRQIPTIKAAPEQYLLQPAETSTSWSDPGFTYDRAKYGYGNRNPWSAPSTIRDSAETAAERPKDPNWLGKAREVLGQRDRKREEERKVHEAAKSSADEFWNPTTKPSFRYLGQAFKLFLICEKDGELWLVDQHAAHERVIFNELKKGEDTQTLLIPTDFEVDSDVDAFLCENSWIYTQYGISVAQKDTNLWTLTAIPHSARDNERRLVEYIRNAVGSEDEIESGLYAIVACKAAVKAGDELDDYAAKALLEKVFELEDPSCPHGRTFVVRLPEKELRMMVGRTS